MQRIRSLKLLTLASAVSGMLLLGGCGGGGGSSPAADVPTGMTVAPSYGQFNSSTPVALKKLDGTVLSSGKVGTDGTAVLSYAGHTGPVLVEVQGGAGVKYWDEGTGQLEDFPDGSTLRALVPTPQASVGVTPLTNATAVKLEAEGGASGFVNITAARIKDVNERMGAVYGIADVLEAPILVASNSAIADFSEANTKHKYAAILAALAKTAPAGSNAAKVAKGFALDMSDGVQDGQYTTSAKTVAVITDGYDSNADVVAKYSAALDFLAPGKPKITGGLTVKKDVSDSKYVTKQQTSDIQLAKDMFNELRTTLNAFVNKNKTGLLDTQAQRVNTDLSSNVSPKLMEITRRVGALDHATLAYDDALAAGTHGFVSGTSPVDGSATMIRQSGNPWGSILGMGDHNICWTGSTAGGLSKITCLHASEKSNYSYSFTSGGLSIPYIAFEVTKENGVYSYTATRYNYSGSLSQRAQLASSEPVGTGTGSVTRDSNGVLSTLDLNGTLPNTDLDRSGYVDKVKLLVTSELLSGTTSTYRKTQTGSISTSKAGALTLTISLDSGSYYDLEVLSTGSNTLRGKWVVTAKTAANTFAGTLEMDNFMLDVNGKNYAPTTMNFNGSVSEVASGGSTLTGKLVAAVSDYAQYDAAQPNSASNYAGNTLAFTGTVQAPGRPLLTLELSGMSSDYQTEGLVLKYSYDNVVITGTGKSYKASSGVTADQNMTISNQDGIQVTLESNQSATTPKMVTKSGVNLAKIIDGMIYYLGASGETQSLF